MDDSPVTDQALDSYLSAQASPESLDTEELGELLATRADPIIRKVVFHRISDSRADAEDVCADAILSLIQRLQRYKEEAGPRPIEDFSSYTAATAHHACDQYLRRKNPALWRLRNRIRYLLEHDAKLATWRDSQGRLLCGFAGWQGQEQTQQAPSPGSFAASECVELRELLFRLFHNSAGPLELSTVIEVARALPDFQLPIGGHTVEADIPDKAPAIDSEIEQRRYAAELWKEIQDLPPRQRSALLLNLKNDAMNLLLLTGVARFRELATALDMPLEELASLWSKLPLEDTEIAQRLGGTRQQIINLRMAARKRLANRLAGWR
jgi:RNA polymerase sigma factor (sigma-70 family)